MANFNLLESAVSNNHHSNNGSNNSKRKVCVYCQRSFHRNSLIRHQKTCAQRSPGSDGKRHHHHGLLPGRREGAEDEPRDSSFKENDVDGCRLLQDGEPPKLQVSSDISESSVEWDFSSEDKIFSGPPTLRSVKDRSKSPDRVRITRITRCRDVSGLENVRKTRATTSLLEETAGKLVTRSSIRSSVNEFTKQLFPSKQQSFIAAKLININSDSAIVGSQLESNLRPSKPSESKPKKNGGASSPTKKRSVSSSARSHSQNRKKSKQDSPGAGNNNFSATTATSTAKSNLVLLSDTILEDFSCQSCSRDFDSLQELRSHGLKYLQSNTLVCLLCSNKKIENLDRHFKEHHQTERKRIQCELCEVTMDRNHHFYHYREHHCLTKKFKCNSCSKQFSSMPSLLLHKSNEHLKELHNSKYCQRNGDMMAVSETTSNNSSSSGSSSNSPEKGKSISNNICKSKYTRRYGAPPRNYSSEKSNSNDNSNCNGNVSFKMNGATASLAMSSSEHNDICHGAAVLGSSSDSSSDHSKLQQRDNSPAKCKKGGERASTDSCYESSSSGSSSSKDSLSKLNAKNEKTVTVNGSHNNDKNNKTGESVKNNNVIKTDLKGEPELDSKEDQSIFVPSPWDVHKEYACRLCPDTILESRYKYLHHLKNVHHWTTEQKMEPEYDPDLWCPECGQEFIVRPTLRKHLIIAHADITDIDDYLERVGYGSRPLFPFQCSVCFNDFESKQQLSFHLRRHGLAYLQYLTANSRF